MYTKLCASTMSIKVTEQQSSFRYSTRKQADEKYDELKHAVLAYVESGIDKGYWIETKNVRKHCIIIRSK
jgi:hypothetical protein